MSSIAIGALGEARPRCLFLAVGSELALSGERCFESRDSGTARSSGRRCRGSSPDFTGNAVRLRGRTASLSSARPKIAADVRADFGLVQLDLSSRQPIRLNSYGMRAIQTDKSLLSRHSSSDGQPVAEQSYQTSVSTAASSSFSATESSLRLVRPTSTTSGDLSRTSTSGVCHYQTAEIGPPTANAGQQPLFLSMTSPFLQSSFPICTNREEVSEEKSVRTIPALVGSMLADVLDEDTLD